MSSKLPPRLYYTPEEAAEALSDHFKEKVTADYLLHLAATERLDLAFLAVGVGAYLIPEISVKPTKDPTTELWQWPSYRESEELIKRHEVRKVVPWDLTDWGFYFLDSSSALSLQRQGSASLSHVRDYTRYFALLYDEKAEQSKLELERGALYAAGLNDDFAIDGFLCIPAHTTGDIEFLKNIKSLSEHEIRQNVFSHEGLSVTRDEVVILQGELDRLTKGEPLKRSHTTDRGHPLIQQPNESQKGKNYQLRTIAALSKALLDSDITEPFKAAGAILKHLDLKGIELPVQQKALAEYLKEANKI